MWSLRTMRIITIAAAIKPVFSSALWKSLRDATPFTSRGGTAECRTGTVRVQVASRNVRVAYEGPRDNLEATQLVVELTGRSQDAAARLLDGEQTVEGTYDVFVQFCTPVPPSPSPRSVQILTHGGTLDHSYWDIAPGFSYVDAMAQVGWATLAYDRLGVGRSEHPDPLQIVQAAVHVEVLHGLTTMLRDAGRPDGAAWDGVVAVGHSVGSYFSLGAADKYPADFDAVVLTGLSAYPDFIPTSFASCAFQIANTVADDRFRRLPNGYLTPAPLVSVYQYNFYHHPNFDREVLIANYEARQTFSIGEVLTIAQFMRPADFTGPSFIVTGERDFVCCGGNCSFDGDMIAHTQSVFLPKAGPASRTYMVPDTGHNIEGHLSAGDVHARILDFLSDNELKGGGEGGGGGGYDSHDEL